MLNITLIGDLKVQEGLGASRKYIRLGVSKKRISAYELRRIIGGGAYEKKGY